MNKILSVTLIISFVLMPQVFANEVCNKVYLIAASAIENKGKGIEKSKMKNVLPPLSSAPKKEPLRSMHEILDEVYDYETHDQEVYSTYRAELCFHRSNGKDIQKNFDVAHEKLSNCVNTVNKIECAMKIAGSDSPK